jgi:rsbT co-antagonist protein RsbR
LAFLGESKDPLAKFGKAKKDRRRHNKLRNLLTMFRFGVWIRAVRFYDGRITHQKSSGPCTSETGIMAKTKVAELFQKNQQELLADWVAELGKATGKGVTSEEDHEQQCKEFIRLLGEGLKADSNMDFENPVWTPVREFLAGVSRTATAQGYTPTETATFIFSLRKPVFSRLKKEIKSVEGLGAELMAVSEFIDAMGLFTNESYQKCREELIAAQQQAMIELSTPVVKLWDGVLALPLIGTLDSARTQVVMESLLQKIVETGSSVAIIDITGVPTVDTLVAQHLLKTVTAARLMGADCIISGIRPQIAQTIVHLGVALNNVVTKASLADAFAMALDRAGLQVVAMRRAGEGN